MITSIIIAAATCLLLIVAVLTKSRVKIGDFKLDIYPFVPVLGAICVICFKTIGIKDIVEKFTSSSSSNPVKIIVLFISMSLLSVLLDESGFFEYIAEKIAQKAGNSQKRIFIAIYLTVSLLTIFTSNDVVILTFTPFICYFASHAKIDPIPYLVAEFIAANTWSMALIIGNPTNIYISSAVGIDFVSYLKVMLLPTLAAGLVALGMLWLCFSKSLSAPIEEADIEEVKIKNKPLLVIGLSILSVCTLIMAVGSYFGIEMWIVSFSAAILLFALAAITSAIQKRRPAELGRCLRRAPWQLVPFVLSMFVIVCALHDSGATDFLGKLLGDKGVVFSYGISSMLAANLINNIPMSVLFVPIIETLPEGLLTSAAYGAIAGSNIGAFLTPVGALAGIMWMSLLKRYGVTLGFKQFVKYGTIISLPTILAALSAIALVL